MRIRQVSRRTASSSSTTRIVSPLVAPSAPLSEAASAGASASVAGSSTSIVVPSPGADWISTVPPVWVTIP